ncbi:MAG TPA: response regulator [Candidatus Mediterraneibacter cottocaccae]|nr:response regulator [Candidatus Mediterraneibacter cottocaccae]
MYKVMIVDDETIILSGIKFLTNWEKHDCVIAATARNGADALEQIRDIQPDLVLADLNMPVMDGITLMEKTKEEFPYIVFIVLTNLEEFDLVREALRLQAVDYLVKSRLEPAVLDDVLERAKKKRDERGRLMTVGAADYFERHKQMEVLNKALQEVVFVNRSTLDEKMGQFLAESGVMKWYGFFYLPFDFAAISTGELPRKEERVKLMNWMRELVLKTADNVFRENYMLVDMGETSALTLFVHHLSQGWGDLAEMFSRKIKSTVKMITQAECQVFHTHIYNGYEDAGKCAEEYWNLQEQYYLGQPEVMLERGENTVAEYEPLGLRGIGSLLYSEITRRNLKGIQSVMDSARMRICQTVHQKSQAIWLLNELNRESSAALSEIGIMDNVSKEKLSSVETIENIHTRSQVLEQLELLRNTLADAVDNYGTSQNAIAVKARRFVLDHMESHVSLGEAAAFAGVTAGYLSMVFKREYHQSFTDFANSSRIEYACHLLKTENLLISEIACRLGYENTYYFSKVFRKYMGMSPTDYQKHIKKEERDEKSADSVKK